MAQAWRCSSWTGALQSTGAATSGASAAAAQRGESPSVFLAFGSEEERDAAAGCIAQAPALGAALPGGREAAAACGSILEVRPAGLIRSRARLLEAQR